jgi:hypothetical protein
MSNTLGDSFLARSTYEFVTRGQRYWLTWVLYRPAMMFSGVEQERESGGVSRTLLPALRGSSRLDGQVLSPVR